MRLIRSLYVTYLQWRNSGDLDEVAGWVREGTVSGTAIVKAVMHINARRDRLALLRGAR